jgi:hypothetical protein
VGQEPSAKITLERVSVILHMNNSCIMSMVQNMFSYLIWMSKNFWWAYLRTNFSTLLKTWEKYVAAYNLNGKKPNPWGIEKTCRLMVDICGGHLQPSSLRRCNPLLNRFTWKLLPPKFDKVSWRCLQSSVSQSRNI